LDNIDSLKTFWIFDFGFWILDLLTSSRPSLKKGVKKDDRHCHFERMREIFPRHFHFSVGEPKVMKHFVARSNYLQAPWIGAVTLV
jgi:hypothetical protein